MRIHYYVIALLCVNAVLATTSFYTGDYKEVTETSSLASCLTVGYDNTTGNVYLKTNIMIGEPSGSQIIAYCKLSNSNISATFYTPMQRNIWVLKSEIPSKVDSYLNFYQIDNYPKFSSVFAKNSKGDLLYKDDYMTYVPAFITNYANNANAYLLYDVVRGATFSKDNAFFYYALAKEQAHGTTNEFPDPGLSGYYYFGDHNVTNPFGADTTIISNFFRSQIYFTDKDLGYPVSDLTNPYLIARNARLCSAFSSVLGAPNCVTESRLDTDLTTPSMKAFFAFSNDLNYYYYPIYINYVVYTVRGYSDSTKATQVYAKTGKIYPTSNRIYVPNDVVGNMAVDNLVVPDNSFNFGTVLNFDGAIGTVPSTVGYFEVETKVYYEFNNMYRHASPADLTWTWGTLTGSSCNTLTPSICNATPDTTDGFYLRNVFNRLTNNTVNIPSMNNGTYNNSPSNGFNDTEPNNNTGNSNSTAGGGDYISGNSTTSIGDDWSSDPTQGGGLQGQIDYARGLNEIQDKASFFEALQTIALTILELILTVFMLLVLVLTIYIFILMIPSAYRKLLNELKKLGDMRWR